MERKVLAEYNANNPLENVEKYLNSNHFLEVLSLGSEFAMRNNRNITVSFKKQGPDYSWICQTSARNNTSDKDSDSLIDVNIHPNEFPNIYPLPNEIGKMVNSNVPIQGLLSISRYENKKNGLMLLLNRQQQIDTLKVLGEQRLQNIFDEVDEPSLILSMLSSSPFNINAELLNLKDNQKGVFEYSSSDSMDKLVRLTIPNFKNFH